MIMWFKCYYVHFSVNGTASGFSVRLPSGASVHSFGIVVVPNDGKN